jgi:dihydrofolate reductase
MPTLELIVARAKNGTIGLNGTMPWHIPEDLKHFRATTMGCPVVMGRKTWESIGRPLPGRTNVVITRNADFTAEGATVVASIEAALELLKQHDRVFIIGGAQLYAQTQDLVSVAWITEIDAEPEGDAFFALQNPEAWDGTLISRLEATDKRPAVAFYRYERR